MTDRLPALLGRIRKAPPPHLCDAWMMMVGLVALHRGILYGRYIEELHALIAGTPRWLLEQYLGLDILTALPWRSLLYLQSAPPIPNALLGAILQVWDWPYEGIAVLLILQAGITATTAALLVVTVARLSMPSWLGWVVGCLFALNPDLIIMESNAFGQSIYESLTMIWVLCALLAFVLTYRRDQARWTVALGLFVSLAALTRASYSLFFLPVLCLLLLFRATRKRRHLLAFALPVLLLHGGWALKNWLIYEHLTPLTSTWGGGNLLLGMVKGGYEAEIVAMLAASPERYPGWFLEMVEEEGLIDHLFNSFGYADYMPFERRADDIPIQYALNEMNPPANWISKARLYDLYGEVFWDFARQNPELVARRIMKSYRFYWAPIRYHARQFMALFATDWVLHGSLSPLQVARWFKSGELPESVYVNSGTWPGLGRTPASLFVPSALYTILSYGVVVLFHLLVPPVLLLELVKRKTCRFKRSPDLVLIVGLVFFIYAAAIHSAVEFGENMRFRLTAEPIVWLVLLIVLRYACRSLETVSRKGKKACFRESLQQQRF